MASPVGQSELLLRSTGIPCTLSHHWHVFLQEKPTWITPVHLRAAVVYSGSAWIKGLVQVASSQPAEQVITLVIARLVAMASAKRLRTNATVQQIADISKG